MSAAVEQPQPKVSVRILRPVVAVLKRHGLDPAVPLREARIEQRIYRNPEARIPGEMALAFVESAAEYSGIEALGLEAGKLYHRSQFDILEYLAASHATLQDTINCVIRYQRLITEAGGFHLEPMGDHSLIRIDMPTTRSHVAETIFVEAFLATIALVGVRILGKAQADVSQSETWFAYPAPPSADACRDFFQGRVRFDAPAHGILVPNDALRAPTQRANASVQSLLEKELDQLASGISNGTSIGDRAASIIAQELADGDPGMLKVAAKLQMSPSTLRRRLAQEGLTHRDLLQTVRERKAVVSLRIQALSLEEVACLVGYDDVTVFHRAFKRWTGLSPHAFRTRVLD